MTRFGKLLLCMIFVLAATIVASAQSLGDVARKERTKQKPQSARTYTNEDIPSVEIPKSEPKSDAPADAKAADATADPNAPKKEGDKDKKDAEKKDEDKTDAEKQAKLNAEWKAKVGDGKAAVATIEREINLMEREERLKVAVYYSDAGNRLRDSKQWADEEKKYQDTLASRQKDLSEAKNKLDSMREAARKAGATSFE